jgi:hypothetical protein
MVEAGGVVGPSLCRKPQIVEKPGKNESLKPLNRALQLETDTKTDTIFGGLVEAGARVYWRRGDRTHFKRKMAPAVSDWKQTGHSAWCVQSFQACSSTIRPQIDPRRLLPKRHLQAHTVCRIDDGFDRSLHNSAGCQFHQQVVADFVVTHISDV